MKAASTVFGAFFVMFSVMGCAYSFGVLYPIFLSEFNGTESSTALISGLSLGAITLVGPAVGFATERFGSRPVVLAGSVLFLVAMTAASYAEALWHLHIFYGVLLGAAMGMCFPPSVVVVSTTFDRHRALATSIVTMGSGVGHAVISPTLQALLDSLGWRDTLRILAVALGSLKFVCALLLHPPPRYADQENGPVSADEQPVSADEQACNKAKGSGGGSMASWLHDRTFRRLALMFTCAAAGFFTPFAFLVRFGQLCHLSSAQAAALGSLAGLSGMLSRPVCGVVADFTGPVLVFGLAMALLALWSAALALIRPLPVAFLYVYAVALGLGGAGFIAMETVILAKFCGVERVASAFGTLLFLETASVLAGPFIFGMRAGIDEGVTRA